jgi:hypothetical protein
MSISHGHSLNYRRLCLAQADTQRILDGPERIAQRDAKAQKGTKRAALKMPLIGDEGSYFFKNRGMDVRTPPLDGDRAVGRADVRLELPKIEKSEMIKERLPKQALQLRAEEVPRKAVGDPDENAAFGHSSGFLQGSQRIIQELESVDKKNKIELVVFER